MEVAAEMEMMKMMSKWCFGIFIVFREINSGIEIFGFAGFRVLEMFQKKDSSAGL